MKKNLIARATAVAALVAVTGFSGHAYVEALYPLQQVLAESFVIAEGVVESHDPAKKIATVKVGKTIKGKCTYDIIRITYGGGQFWHPEAVPKHFVKGAPTLIFYNEGRQAEMYMNRFFIQLYGDAGAPPDKAWWSMTHIEIRMNRTFNGTVEELTDTVQKVLAGKMKPPPPDAKIGPIDKPHVAALPAYGEPVDEAKLPAPFVKRASKVAKPRDAENPAGVGKGLAFQYYEGTWTALPEFDKLTPAKSGTFERPALQAANRPENFALRFTGFIDIAKEGLYTFYTNSNDGSALFIGTTRVVNNDHHHGVVEQSGEIALKPGKHAITVTYFQAGGSQTLEVSWEGPELQKQPLPAAVLFRPATP